MLTTNKQITHLATTAQEKITISAYFVGEEGAMAEVVASSLLKVVFDKLSSGVLKEYGLLMGVDKQLAKLESTLSTIQDVLEDAETRQVKEKALKGWLRKLKDVAYDADDVVDEFSAKSARWRPEKRISKTDKVRNFFMKPNSIVFHHKIADKIKEIRERLDEIAEERSRFHLREGIVGREESDAREPTGSFIIESEVYGRQKDREMIIDLVMNVSSGGGGDLGVIAIVGLGGLGKTTVAQLVYNDERVCDSFERRIWVCVSDEFDVRRISTSIIESVTGKEYNLSDVDSMQRSVREVLEGERYLLVLDDIWNENYEKWDKLRILLNCGAKGSRIIVTTRSERVASIMATVAPHLLAGLSEADCWSLFERRAFGLGGAKKTPNFERIGMEIVKKCGGVPLAAKALGSLLRFKKGESEWLIVKNNEIWKLGEDENEILPALMLSYNHLPSRLKQCFAYCSMFPKDYNIRMEELVQLWMAEGFIRSSVTNANLEAMGLQYVDELLARSLFQTGELDADGVVTSVKLHDLVHDLAQFVAGEECSIIDADTGGAVLQASRYSSIHISKGISDIIEPLHQAKRLRTLYLVPWSGRANGRRVIEKSDHLLRVIFSNMKLLRALHLTHNSVKHLPDSVTNLRHLRYLSLSITHLDSLPSCIGTLHNLQILNLDHNTQLRALPDSIGELHNLSILDLTDCQGLTSLPSSIGCLRNLRKLNLALCTFLQALPESVCDLLNLQELNLRHCYMLGELPENIGNLINLVHLDIRSCPSLTEMPAGIGQLTNLKTLTVFVLGEKNRCNLGELRGLNLQGELRIKNLETVRNSLQARDANLKEKANLRSLELEWVRRMTCDDPDDIEETSLMTRLLAWVEELQQQDRDADAKLDEDVFEGLQPHTNLEVVSLQGYLGGMFPIWMMELSLPHLVELSLNSCIRCERLPPCGQLPFLKKLNLFMLPSVKYLGSGFYGGHGAFPSLEELELVFLLGLEEWSSVGHEEIFPRLSKLSLIRCPNLKALPCNFPFVSELTLEIDDELLLSNLQNGAFPNLTHLNIERSDHHDMGDDDDMPEVLTKRIATIQSWSLK